MFDQQKHEYHRTANPRGLPTRLSPKLAKQILPSTGYCIELLMPNNPIRCTSYYIHIKSIYVSAYSSNNLRHSSVLTNDRTALSDGQLTRVNNNKNIVRAEKYNN